jgi:hypothetical protein
MSQFTGVGFNLRTQCLEPVTLEEPRLTKRVKTLQQVHFSDGSIVRCTPEHNFLLDTGRYKNARNLKPGMVLRTVSTDERPLEQISVTYNMRITLKTPVNVYDVTTITHNFALGNGVVVHNSSRYARNSDYQEILPLRGKLLNAYKSKPDQLFKNEEVMSVLQTIGYNPELPEGFKLRAGKIILLSDSDPDGCHINVLEAALLLKLMPDLFSQGRVYAAVTPKYLLKHKSDYYFANSVKEMREKVPKGTPLDNLSQLKGWSECSPEALRKIAFDPASRQLVQLQPPSPKKRQQFLELMGKDAAMRKKLLNIP